MATSSEIPIATELPISYVDPLFRPPSEANSLILQVTNGCSWNRCRFCEMYSEPQKKFSIKSEDDVLGEILWAAKRYPYVRRVFLADGDAMTLPFNRLDFILKAIRKHLPQVNRISAYCLPRNLRNKTDEELAALADLGLKLVYVGAESGDDQILDYINKGETFESTLNALNRLNNAGIKRSVMIIHGLGGKRFTEQHAFNSARLANAAQPEYLATLVINFPKGQERFQQGFEEQFERMSPMELFAEQGRMIEQLELDSTIFRSDHASNQLVLKGTLNKDKPKLLEKISQVLESPEYANLRPLWERDL